MKPPTSTVGVLVYGLGIAAVGTAAGAWIGAQLSPPDPSGSSPVVSNKLIGAGQGGLVGLLTAGLASTIYGQFKPGWRSPAAVVDVLGSAVVLLGVSSVVIAPRLAVAASPAASQLAPPGKIVNITPMDVGKTINTSVGDTIYITLPNLPASGQGWFYKGTAAGFTYNGRSSTPTSTTPTMIDSWTAAAKGTVSFTLQAFPVDTAGNAVAGATATSTFTVQVMVS